MSCDSAELHSAIALRASGPLNPIAPASSPLLADVAIRVEGLSKKYEIYDKPRDRLKQFVIPRMVRSLPILEKVFRIHGGPDGQRGMCYFREFWALRNVSFDVGRGETVGIIGANGSGKSTLLQLICGTLTPTSGSVRIRGRVAALLELGSGFNPEFTGRENIYLNASVLGLARAEIDARFDEIAAFADIGAFLEQPVKTYSSGMVVRLAFAVNIMTAPQVMVVDEALSVGDMAFQAKCMTALDRLRDSGATVLFVSHDVSAVKSLCSRAVYLEEGATLAQGPAAEVAELYVRSMRKKINVEHAKAALPSRNSGVDAKQGPSRETASSTITYKDPPAFAEAAAMFRYGTGEAQVVFAELLNEDGENVSYVEFDETVQIRIHVLCRDATTFSVAYYIHDENKIPVLGAWVELAGHRMIEGRAGDRFIVTYRTRLPLQEGHYSIQLELAIPVILDQTTSYVDVVNDGVLFQVGPRSGAKVWSKVFLQNTVDVHPLLAGRHGGDL
jgi:lipopolysaccharide transport system ATP-binding protein